MVQLPNNHSSDEYINLDFKILRILYFFSENGNISEFLNNSDLELRITKGINWNDSIAHGSSKVINKFQSSVAQGQKNETVIYMFFNDD